MSHEQAVGDPAEDAERHAVCYLIGNDGAFLGSSKRMRVMPEGIGASQLDVYKRKRWFKMGDERCPAQIMAVECDNIVDDRAVLHLNRPRREHVKSQPARRQPSEILRLRKEVEDFSKRPLDQLLLL